MIWNWVGIPRSKISHKFFFQRGKKFWSFNGWRGRDMNLLCYLQRAHIYGWVPYFTSLMLELLLSLCSDITENKRRNHYITTYPSNITQNNGRAHLRRIHMETRKMLCRLKVAVLLETDTYLRKFGYSDTVNSYNIHLKDANISTLQYKQKLQHALFNNYSAHLTSATRCNKKNHAHALKSYYKGLKDTHAL